MFIMAHTNRIGGSPGVATEKEQNRPIQSREPLNESNEGRWQATRRGVEWWATEPSVGRVANGIPKRVDRLRCLGNAVVPHVGMLVGEMLLRIHEGE